MKSTVSAVDLTQGSILLKLLRFAVPILIGNLLQELYGVVDTLIVGRTLGVEKLAAVGATGPLTFLVVGFAVGLCSGCAVRTSRDCGAGDEAALRRGVTAHYVIAAVFSVLFTALMLLLAGPLLQLLQTPPDALPHARSYLMIIYAGIPATVLYNLLASLLRAVGDSKTPLWFLVFSSLLNIALDLLFILAFGWDVAGAAAATVLSQLISGLLCLLYIRRKDARLLPSKQELASIGPAVRDELKIGAPLGFQHALIAFGMNALQFFLNGFGSSAVAAYTIGGKIQSLMQNPIVSMNAVMATFAGQNLGAGRLDRVREGVRKGILISVCYAVAAGALVWLLRRPITLLFVDAAETAAIEQTWQYLAWCCPLLWALGFLFSCRGALQGLGDGVTPLLSSVLELLMRFAIPLLFRSALGYTSICIAGTAAWVSCAAMIAIVYLIKIRRVSAQQQAQAA